MVYPTDFDDCPPPVTEPDAATALVEIDDIAEDGAALVAAAYWLCSGLFPELGLPDVSYLTADGAVRRRYWYGGNQQQIGDWAKRVDVEVTDAIVP